VRIAARRSESIPPIASKFTSRAVLENPGRPCL
jgi:hypothetical protein